MILRYSLIPEKEVTSRQYWNLQYRNSVTNELSARVIRARKVSARKEALNARQFVSSRFDRGTCLVTGEGGGGGGRIVVDTLVSVFADNSEKRGRDLNRESPRRR